MQAKVYAPSLEHRKEGLKVAERFWTKQRLIRVGLYAGVPLVLGWYNSGFGFPFTPDRDDFAGGVLAAILGEIITFLCKKDRAKFQAEENAEATQDHGPLQYRLTETGVDFWAAGESHHDGWDKFRKFKLTNELLILVYSGRHDDYWVFPRQDIGEPLLSIALSKLEESGAIRAAER